MTNAYADSSLTIYSPEALALELRGGDAYGDWLRHQLKDSTRKTYSRAAVRFTRFVGEPLGKPASGVRGSFYLVRQGQG